MAATAQEEPEEKTGDLYMVKILGSTGQDSSALYMLYYFGNGPIAEDLPEDTPVLDGGRRIIFFTEPHLAQIALDLSRPEMR